MEKENKIVTLFETENGLWGTKDAEGNVFDVPENFDEFVGMVRNRPVPDTPGYYHLSVYAFNSRHKYEENLSIYMKDTENKPMSYDEFEVDRFIPLHRPEYYNGNRAETVKNGDFTEFDKLDEDQKIEVIKTWNEEMRIMYLSRNSITDDDFSMNFIELLTMNENNINGIRVYIENGEQRLCVQDSFYFLFQQRHVPDYYCPKHVFTERIISVNHKVTSIYDFAG